MGPCVGGEPCGGCPNCDSEAWARCDQCGRWFEWAYDDCCRENEDESQATSVKLHAEADRVREILMDAYRKAVAEKEPT